MMVTMPPGSNLISMRSFMTPPNSIYGATAQLALLFGFLAPGGKPVPIGKRQALIHQLLEFAAVVGVMGGRRVRYRPRGNEIAAPQLDAIDAGHLGRLL